MPKNQKKWCVLLLSVYGLLMLWLLFGQRWGQAAGGLNLELFDTVLRYIRVLRYSQNPELLHHAIINLGGNVAMFVPLGFFVPCIWEKMGKLGWHALCMLLTIIAIEALQLATGLGTCDIDDLILNLVGTAMGYGLFKLWNILRSKGGA